MTPAETADMIIELYRNFGNADYIGEPVSQIEHMCQCAQLAEASGADEEMILAAFFHDIGHLYEHIAEDTTEHMDKYGTVDHETLGAAFLIKAGFGERMAKLVASHVNAKRYLVAKYPEYREKLSDASIQTLQLQGGPMTADEVAAFEADHLSAEYVQLRRWDEEAKLTNQPLPDLNHYKKMMINQLEKTFMLPVKLVVFDLAGTTVKDGGEIAICFQTAMQAFGYRIPSEDIYPLMGYRKPQAIRMMLEKYETDSEKITRLLVDDIHDMFEKNMIDFYANTTHIEALPFAESTFGWLKERGVRVGFDTGFSKVIANTIMNRLGWIERGLADWMVASDEVPAGRPYPFMIERMMEWSGISDARQVIKVGDTEVDVMEAKNAGCLLSIAVTTGAFTKEALLPYEPDHIVDSLEEIIPILTNLNE